MIKLIKEKSDILIKTSFIILSIFFIMPSIVYLIKNKSVMGFCNYYNFFINDGSNKIFSSIIYLIIFVCMMIIYFCFIKRRNMFKSIKNLLIYVAIVSGIFMIMLPWTSSDIFYYMGVGELDSVYHQNAYYITMRAYYDANSEIVQDDEILKQGANNGWANTTVVYGPIAQFIFSICARISFKNINICLAVFKLVNIIIHILNCYLIYKITKKIKFSIIYGLNPFILLEFIGIVHNDVIVVFFTLLALYFLLKKKKLMISIFFLALATGIKYYSILLLPICVLYHFRNEKKIFKRILKCILYGIIFVAIILLEYVIYLKDINVFTAMMAQTTKYCKSIYSALVITSWMYQIENTWVFILTYIALIFFGFIYFVFCFKLLLNKKINFFKIIRKYNFIFIIFLLALSNFQQWYLIGFFSTIMWQKSNTIKNIIGLSAISEIANSIYMFKTESWVYDNYFVGIIIFLFILWKLCTNKKIQKKRNLTKYVQ